MTNFIAKVADMVPGESNAHSELYLPVDDVDFKASFTIVAVSARAYKGKSM